MVGVPTPRPLVSHHCSAPNVNKKLSYRWQTARCCFVKLFRYCRTFCQTSKVWLSDGEKNSKICLFVLTWFTNVTDGGTDRHRMTASIDRACIASRGKNASQYVPVYLQQFPSYSNHNCKKIAIFCLPWGRPCGNHAKRCMNKKTIQCLPNPSQHVPIYLQQFPSYSNCKCKKIAVFTYRSPHFCFPWRHPCDYHAICCMDGKSIQCLSNLSQHIPIYLQ